MHLHYISATALLFYEQERGYLSREVMKRSLFDYPETFCNRNRRCSGLGYHPTAVFEEMAAQLLSHLPIKRLGILVAK